MEGRYIWYTIKWLSKDNQIYSWKENRKYCKSEHNTSTDFKVNRGKEGKQE